MKNNGLTKSISWIFYGECIRCTSHALSSAGYPQFARFGNGKKTTIARAILLRRYPDQSRICRHTCDNAWCINPEHLIPGTTADNSRDMVERGRNRNQYTKGSKQ